jgi:hypothetical protein
MNGFVPAVGTGEKLQRRRVRDVVECQPEVDRVSTVDPLERGVLMPWGGRATTAVLDEQVVEIAHHTLGLHQLARKVGYRAVVTASREGFDAVAHIEVEEEAGAVVAADLGGHRGWRAPGLLAAGENRREVARFDHPPETDDPVGLECADGVFADDASNAGRGGVGSAGAGMSNAIDSRSWTGRGWSSCRWR